MTHPIIAGRRVLIAGGTGFLGKHLARAILKAEPAQLTLTSRRAAQLQGAQCVALDLLDKEAVEDFFRANEFDLVYNLAGRIDQGVHPGVYGEQFSVHVQTTINLVDALVGRPLMRFFQFGSSMEYGDAPYPQLNRERELPLSAYGVSKLAATKIVLARCRSERLPGVVLRPFLVYGPGQSKRSFLQSALEAARSGAEFHTTGGGQTRDFTPVKKFVEDTLAVSSLPSDGSVGEVFNVCTGVEIYLRTVLDVLQFIYPNFRPQMDAMPYRSSEVMHSVGAAFRPWSAEQTKAALYDFLRGAP